jgi:ATP-dependent helicase YprA (DUF1998 family)
LFIPFYSPIVHKDNDELVAIELEIAEIDQQINRLRHQRSFLSKRQQKLKDSIKRNQQSITNSSDEQWKRTSIKRKTFVVVLFSFLDFPWSEKVDEIRTEIFKINSFRQWQLETINVTLSGYDCILIMPTGGGKSLCYQLPALISDGKIEFFL